MYRDIPKEEWASELDAFTERHAQRPTVIEVDSPQFGAQEQAHDYPLRGVVYDHRDERISIMLGEVEGTEPHLTHSIAGLICGCVIGFFETIPTMCLFLAYD